MNNLERNNLDVLAELEKEEQDQFIKAALKMLPPEKAEKYIERFKKLS